MQNNQLKQLIDTDINFLTINIHKDSILD